MQVEQIIYKDSKTFLHCLIRGFSFIEAERVEEDGYVG
jgi:hypothetical protein